MSINKTPKRPNPSEACQLKAAKMIANKVVNWGNHATLNAAMLALHIAASFERHMTGYELAKALDDNHGYEPDLEMVTELDEMEITLRDEYNKELRQWVVDCNIVPPFPDGTVIKQGVITGLSASTPASFEVLMNGYPSDTTTRMILPFEKAQLEIANDKSA